MPFRVIKSIVVRGFARASSSSSSSSTLSTFPARPVRAYFSLSLLFPSHDHYGRSYRHLSYCILHLNHLHHHLFVSNNKHHLFLNHLHSFFVKNHQCHQLLLLPKQSSVVWVLYLFHHDQLLLNVFHLFHQNHVKQNIHLDFLY